MPSKKAQERAAREALQEGPCQGSFWTTYGEKRLVVRAATKKSKRVSAKAGRAITITPSVFKRDAVMAATKAELARK